MEDPFIIINDFMNNQLKAFGKPLVTKLTFNKEGFQRLILSRSQDRRFIASSSDIINLTSMKFRGIRGELILELE